MSEPKDMGVTLTAIESIRKTVGDQVDILCVDDFSPDQKLVDGLEGEIGQLNFEVIRKEANEGFSTTVNHGLRRALAEGRDAVLMNADMEMQTPDWVTRCQQTTDGKGRPAAVVGALLTYPTGLIQHAGIYFSLVTRTFDHMHKYGPANLPEALEKKECPVTGAFQYIRHETLEKVGLYDEKFRMGWEDVDYCIRVFLKGFSCVYNPNIRAIHHEMMFRGKPSEKIRDWQNQSFMLLCLKYEDQSFAGLVPFL
jgi:GT2 family glycosyltransferase